MRVSHILRTVSEPPALNLVRQMLKDAMRAKQPLQKQTYRAVLAATQNANIAKPNSVNSDVAVGSIVLSLYKKRIESASEYIKGKREDLAENEKKEASVLQEVLSKLNLASEEDVRNKVSEFIKTNEVKNMKEAMQKLPKQVEEEWRAPKSMIVQELKTAFK